MEVIKNLLYEKIVQKYGSPLFIYDLSTITDPMKDCQLSFLMTQNCYIP